MGKIEYIVQCMEVMCQMYNVGWYNERRSENYDSSMAFTPAFEQNMPVAL